MKPAKGMIYWCYTPKGSRQACSSELADWHAKGRDNIYIVCNHVCWPLSDKVKDGDGFIVQRSEDLQLNYALYMGIIIEAAGREEVKKTLHRENEMAADIPFGHLHRAISPSRLCLVETTSR